MKRSMLIVAGLCLFLGSMAQAEETTATVLQADTTPVPSAQPKRGEGAYCGNQLRVPVSGRAGSQYQGVVVAPGTGSMASRR